VKAAAAATPAAHNFQQLGRRALATGLLDESSKNALIAATADVLGISRSAVSIVDERIVDPAEAELRIIVTLRILVQPSDFPGQTITSNAELFNTVSSLFTASVSGGTFDTALTATVVEFQAAALDGIQHDPTVTVAPPTYTAVDTTSDSGGKSDLTGGEYAGIVIGVVVVFLLIIAGVYFLVAGCGGGENKSAVMVQQGDNIPETTDYVRSQELIKQDDASVLV
jgi:hypothetical protein